MAAVVSTRYFTLPSAVTLKVVAGAGTEGACHGGAMSTCNRPPRCHGCMQEAGNSGPGEHARHWTWDEQCHRTGKEREREKRKEAMDSIDRLPASWHSPPSLTPRICMTDSLDRFWKYHDVFYKATPQDHLLIKSSQRDGIVSFLTSVWCSDHAQRSRQH